MTLVYDTLITNVFFWLIVIFLFTQLIVPIIYGGKFLGILKEIILSIVVLIIGYITLSNNVGRIAFLIGIIAAGILSSFDIFFTFMFFGNLDIVRILDLFSGNQVVLNHNYPGFLAGVGLIYIYIVWKRYNFNRFILITAGLILAAGTLLSTSRSAFLAIFLIFILLNFMEKDLRGHIRIIVAYGLVMITLVVGIFMIYEFGVLSKDYHTFAGKFYYRLYEEPLEAFGAEEAGFNPYTGERLGGSVKFRSEKWAKDLDKFFNKDIPTQVLGLGPGGYSKISEKVYRESGNVRYQLATHNGYLIIMFEQGYFGLILYLIILASLTLKYFKINSQFPIKMPVIYLILLIAIYSFGQNAELTSRFMYLAFGGLISDIYYYHDEELSN